jgi:predicted Zn-dependent protease
MKERKKRLVRLLCVNLLAKSINEHRTFKIALAKWEEGLDIQTYSVVILTNIASQ